MITLPTEPQCHDSLPIMAHDLASLNQGAATGAKTVAGEKPTSSHPVQLHQCQRSGFDSHCVLSQALLRLPQHGLKHAASMVTEVEDENFIARWHSV